MKNNKLVQADDQEIKWWMKEYIPKKMRESTDISSFWLKGVHFSRISDDERLLQLRSKMLLVLSRENAPIDDDNDEPKCSLCEDKTISEYSGGDDGGKDGSTFEFDDDDSEATL
ncbi:hypothetical protein C2S53_019440 [Perilla frutescens var. hirtella]|uniref:Uncharacterized protein n=1 Tax=Perilla frutescens var. hirtella TaxID=608512 RepID=A0AAD4PC57_PERFH|nr:hypothetical protein C2S53_019440 [Perilla frutescens var. hirtella]